MAASSFQPPVEPTLGRIIVALPTPPRALAETDLRLLSHDCSLLLVRLNVDGSLWLNNELNGGLNELGSLRARLSDIFQQRADNRVIASEYMDREDLPIGERIRDKVVIKAPRSATYGDVMRVIDVVRSSGSKNIGVQIDDLH